MENKTDYTRKILKTMRQFSNKTSRLPEVPLMKENKEMSDLEFYDYLMRRNEKGFLNEENEHMNKEFVINKKTPQFGDVFTSQEDALKKTVGEAIDLGEKALVYYPNEKDLVLSGKIKSMNIAFQFRYADPSGDGIYIWTNGLQLTESNLRTVGKIRDAFMNWKQNLVQNGDLIDKLHKVSTKD